MGLIHPVGFLGSSPPLTEQSIEYTTNAQYGAKSSPVGCDFTTTFTLETWVKFSTLPSNSESWLIRRYDFANNYGWYLAVEDIFGTKSLRLHYGDGTTDQELYSVYSFLVDTWYHVAGAYFFNSLYDPDRNYGYITIDGDEKSASYITGSNQMIAPTGQILLANTNVGGKEFLGKMAETRIWSTRRTKTQISDNMGVRKTGAEAGLVSVFPWSGVS